jgi:parallel beta-helix repeat protein
MRTGPSVPYNNEARKSRSVTKGGSGLRVGPPPSRSRTIAVLLILLACVVPLAGCLRESADQEASSNFWDGPRPFQDEVSTGSTCADSLQAKVDSAPVGATVKAEPCVYREHVTIDKPITLHGRPGSEIRGSDVWEDWVGSDGIWRSEKTLPDFPQTEVQCMPGTSRCLWPEQVFFDGRPLEQVASDPGPGQFAVDADRNVLLDDDPRGHLVEVSVRRYWVLGEADDVTIEGFTMRHAANGGRTGAIMNRPGRMDGGYDNWTVRDNRLSDAHGAVVSLKNATGLEILGNDISRGGQLGIKDAGDGEVIRGNKVHDNNTEDFDWGWEAGGFKAVLVSDVIVDSNEFYYNNGNAVWFDIDVRNSTISDNRIHDNARRGIHYEISEGGEIFGNDIWENGWGTPDWASGAGIGVSNSSNTEVYGNTLAWNADGIAVVGLDREGTSWDRVHDVYVHDNIIFGQDRPEDPEEGFALAWLQGWSEQMFDPSNNNRGQDNRYWYPSPEGDSVRYNWADTSESSLADFNTTPGEQNGRYLSEREKDAVVGERHIPASPRQRR